MKSYKLGLVVADFNEHVTGAMLRAAQEEAQALNAEICSALHVPGAYELPLIVCELLTKPELDAVIVLGYVERGETQHGEVMASTVMRSLMSLSLEKKKPIGYGIIGPGALLQQAEVRKDGYARAAVHAAIKSVDVLEEMQIK
jgi:6,7-dimethyl-8-ribityllumazine synthase